MAAKKTNLQQITISVTPLIYQTLKNYADSTGKAFSEVVRQSIERGTSELLSELNSVYVFHKTSDERRRQFDRALEEPDVEMDDEEILET